MTEEKTTEPWYKKWWAITIFVLVGLMIIIFFGNEDENKQQNIKKTESTIDTKLEQANKYAESVGKKYCNKTNNICKGIVVEVKKCSNDEKQQCYLVDMGEEYSRPVEHPISNSYVETIKSEENDEKENLQTNVIINIHEILGKSLEEIEKIIGKADEIKQISPSKTSCENNPCDKGLFQSGKYEIVFIDDKASWITITPKVSYPLNEESIELIGLPKTAPTVNNKSILLRWENIGNVKEASFFDNGSGEIDYIYVKAELN